MLNALRRVISDTSDIGDQQSQQRASQEGHDEGGGHHHPQSPSAIVPPHTIVVEDEDMLHAPQPDNNRLLEASGTTNATAPLALVHSGGTGQSDNCTASSSLSDGSIGNPPLTDEDEIMEEEEPRAEKHHQHPSYPAEEPKLGVVVEEAAQSSRMETEPVARSSPVDTPATRQKQPQEPATAAPATTLQRMDSASATNESSGSSGSHRNTSSQTSSRDWGWFEDVHISDAGLLSSPNLMQSAASKKKPSTAAANAIATPQEIIKVNNNDEAAAAMAVTAPTYVLEESLSSQKLWKDTAGNRPPQPVEERAFYEKMWAQNFARSQVNYQMPVEVLTATSPISLNPFADGVFEGTTETQTLITDYNQFAPGGVSNAHHPPPAHDGTSEADAAVTEAALISRMHDMTEDSKNGGSSVVGVGSHYPKVPGSKSDGDLAVLLRGPNAFGTTVSKSFARSTDNGGAIVGVDTVNISIASYRVVESRKYGKYAQFLVIYREGSIRDTVGVWKRYRDFEELSNKVTHAHEGCAAVIANMSPLAVTEEPETEHLPNAITSWRLLKKRKRWYRCLDAGYLSLKVFLLERFLHDILFESSSPKLLRDFVLGAEGGSSGTAPDPE